MKFNFDDPPTPAGVNMAWNAEMPSLSDFPNTKEIAYHPFFRGQISRFLWKLMTLTLTPCGRWLLGATLVATAAASITLQTQPYVLFCYAAGIWITAFIYCLIGRPRVTATVVHSDRATAGEVLPIDVCVTQTGRGMGHDLTVLPHRLPPALDADPADGVRLPPIASGGKVVARIGILCRNRGVHHFGGYRVQTDYPFGVLRAYRVAYQPRELLVYPRFGTLDRMSIPTGRRYQPGGIALASDIGESFEFLGNRDYHPGDSVRDIDWRATARLQRPIVREYREEYFLRVGVVLDTWVPASTGARLDDFERAVSTAASIADYLSRRDYLVDIFAAGAVLHHLTAGRSLAFLDQVLDILACVESSQREPFAILEPAILEHLSGITTVICVFLDWSEERQAFVRRLAQSGAGVRAIVVRDGACTLDPGAAEGVSSAVRVIDRAEFDAGLREI
ncbi:MAG: DUF58 domain-containing protein [Capsulimonadaceae bacterium]